MTIHVTMRPAAVVLIATLVAACGSGPAASQRAASTPAGGGGATPGATAAAPAPTGAAATGAATPAAATALPAGGTHACDWITEAEMTTILGGTIATPDRARAEPDNCDWSSANRSVFINIHEDEPGTIQALRIGDPKIEDLNIGEGGVWSSVSRGAYLLKGGRVLAVQVIFVPASLAIRDVAVAVATAALARF